MKHGKPAAAILLLGCGVAATMWLPAGGTSSTQQTASQNTLLRVEAGPDLVTIDMPSTRDTEPTAINSNGDVVGNYVLTNSLDGSHGFLLRQGKFTTIDYPGAKSTMPTGINDSGQIVGNYSDGTGFHNFSSTPEGVFRTVVFSNEKREEGSRITIRGVMNSGTILGVASGRGTNVVLYLLEGSTARVLQTLVSGSAPGGISLGGSIVGYMPPEGPVVGFRRVGFLFQNGALSTFQYPEADATYPRGLNDHSELVGEFRDASNYAHCFRRGRGGEFAELSIPNTSSCVANAISNNGEVIGYYRLKGNLQKHGFRWRPGAGTPAQRAAAETSTGKSAPAGAAQAPSAIAKTSANAQPAMARGELITLEVPGALLPVPRGINSRGDVVGEVQAPTLMKSFGFLWRQGNYATFEFPSTINTFPRGISDDGTIVGHYETASVPGISLAFSRTPDGAFRRIFTPMELLASTSKMKIVGISNSGMVFGEFEGNSYGSRQVFRVDQGVFRLLYTLTADNHILSANSAGVTVGFLDGGFGTSGRSAFFWRGGALNQFRYPGAHYSSAAGINDRGEIAGDYLDDKSVSHCFRRDAAGSFSTIEIPGATSCSATGINNAGAVIGTYWSAEGTQAFVWRPSSVPPVQTAAAGAPAATPTARATPPAKATEPPADMMINTMVKMVDPLVEAENWAEVEKTATTYKMLAPSRWEPYWLLGLARNKLAKYALALPDLATGLQIARHELTTYPNSAQLKTGIQKMLGSQAQAYGRMGMKREAIDAAFAADGLGSNADTQRLLCLVFVENSPTNSLSFCNKAVDSNFNDPEVHFGRAMGWFQHAKLETAQGRFDPMVQQTVDDLKYYLMMKPAGSNAGNARTMLKQLGQ